MTVGERIKNRRIELGLTQEELALKMGYSGGKSTVCKAETCGDDITTAKIKKYAKYLDCSFDYLMGWEKKIPLPENVDKHMELISLFEQASPEQQEVVMNILRQLVKKGE